LVRAQHRTSGSIKIGIDPRRTAETVVAFLHLQHSQDLSFLRRPCVAITVLAVECSEETHEIREPRTLDRRAKPICFRNQPESREAAVALTSHSYAVGVGNSARNCGINCWKHSIGQGLEFI